MALTTDERRDNTAALRTYLTEHPDVQLAQITSGSLLADKLAKELGLGTDFILQAALDLLDGARDAQKATTASPSPSTRDLHAGLAPKGSKTQGPPPLARLQKVTGQDPLTIESFAERVADNAGILGVTLTHQQSIEVAELMARAEGRGDGLITCRAYTPQLQTLVTNLIHNELSELDANIIGNAAAVAFCPHIHLVRPEKPVPVEQDASLVADLFGLSINDAEELVKGRGSVDASGKPRFNGACAFLPPESLSVMRDLAFLVQVGWWHGGGGAPPYGSLAQLIILLKETPKDPTVLMMARKFLDEFEANYKSVPQITLRPLSTILVEMRNGVTPALSREIGLLLDARSAHFIHDINGCKELAERLAGTSKQTLLAMVQTMHKAPSPRNLFGPAAALNMRVADAFHSSFQRVGAQVNALPPAAKTGAAVVGVVVGIAAAAWVVYEYFEKPANPPKPARPPH